MQVEWLFDQDLGPHSHSVTAFVPSGLPQEIIGKNQFSLLWPGKSRKTSRFGSPVCDEWTFLCSSCIYECKKWCVEYWPFYPWSLVPGTSLPWLLLSSSRKQALHDWNLYGTHIHDEKACNLKKPFERVSSHCEDKIIVQNSQSLLGIFPSISLSQSLLELYTDCSLPHPWKSPVWIRVFYMK